MFEHSNAVNGLVIIPIRNERHYAANAAAKS